jgi:hypothetical protein
VRQSWCDLSQVSDLSAYLLCRLASTRVLLRRPHRGSSPARTPCWLIGWGGATDAQANSCAVVTATDQGTSVKMQGCTLQFHSDSKHTLENYLVLVVTSAHVALYECGLVAAAPGNTTVEAGGVGVHCNLGACVLDSQTVGLHCATLCQHVMQQCLATATITITGGPGTPCGF